MKFDGVTIQKKPFCPYFHIVLFSSCLVCSFSNHLNETPLAVLSRGNVCFFSILQNKILFSFHNFDFGFFIEWKG